MFDQLFYKAILSYKAASKKRKHQQIISLATFYIAMVQLAILFVCCIVFVKATQSSFLTFYKIYTPIFYSIITGVVLYVFNLLYYNGKRLLQIKNKAIQEKNKGIELWKLWSIPVVIAGLGFILLQSV